MEDKIEKYQEQRPWGSFLQFTKNVLSTVKIIFVKPNEQLSLQSHSKRSEFWKVISGSGVFEVDGKKVEVAKGDEQEVPLGSKHRMASGSEGMEILEIGLGDFDENDITRYEDKYGRV